MMIAGTKAELRDKLIAEFGERNAETVSIIDQVVREAERHEGPFRTYQPFLDVHIYVTP